MAMCDAGIVRWFACFLLTRLGSVGRSLRRLLGIVSDESTLCRRSIRIAYILRFCFIIRSNQSGRIMRLTGSRQWLLPTWIWLKTRWFAQSRWDCRRFSWSNACRRVVVTKTSPLGPRVVEVAGAAPGAQRCGDGLRISVHEGSVPSSVGDLWWITIRSPLLSATSSPSREPRLSVCERGIWWIVRRRLMERFMHVWGL